MRRCGLMLALDLPDADAALAMLARVGDQIDGVKIGLRLFVAEGPAFVRRVIEQKPVFLDLKFHDIPNTVAEAVQAAGKLGVAIVNVHAAGGMRMMEAAAEAAKDFAMQVVAVTVLTSEHLPEEEARAIVLERARQAKQAGLHGVVCSAWEASAVRQCCGEDFLILTPGIRWRGTRQDDQARLATPEDGVRAGADWIIVGRPILKADDPAAVAAKIKTRMAISS